MTMAELPAYRSANRCKYGNVNWHTGHEILKKAAITGPFSSNFPSEYSLPSSDFRVKPGATCPTAIVVKGASHPSHRESLCDKDIERFQPNPGNPIPRSPLPLSLSPN